MISSSLRILYVGPDYRGSNGRCWRDAFIELGHQVSTFDDEKPLLPSSAFASRLRRKLRGRPPEDAILRLNEKLRREVARFRPDFTIYIKGAYILPETFEATAKHGPNLAYMNDDMFNSVCRSYLFFEGIRRMDCIFTTKSYNVREFHAAGAAKAVYIPNAYDPSIHYPAEPTPTERATYEGDVAFIGTFWAERADLLSFLLKRRDELKLNVWGGQWQKMSRADNWHCSWRWRELARCVRTKELWCEDMGKAIQANKICLGLLCHDNRDLHTSRSFEIPACGGFMLAERTEEHRMYFAEDKEAVYFGSRQELMDKIRFYLGHEPLRQKIAAAGHERCLSSNARYTDRALFALEEVRRLRPRIHKAADVDSKFTASWRRPSAPHEGLGSRS